MDFSTENLGTASLAIGALGTASYGVVDGLYKSFTWFDSAGFERVFAVGGKEGGRRFFPTHKATLDPLLPALRIAYGSDVMELLRAQYRVGRASGDLPRTLRQGARIGFGVMEASSIALASGDASSAPPPKPIIAMPVARPGLSGNQLMSVATGAT